MDDCILSSDFGIKGDKDDVNADGGKIPDCNFKHIYEWEQIKTRESNYLQMFGKSDNWLVSFLFAKNFCVNSAAKI